MDKKTLEEQLEVAKRKKGWFCPQINGTCNHECYCYIPPSIKELTYSDNTVKSNFQDAFCIHALHQEQIEVNAIIQQ